MSKKEQTFSGGGTEHPVFREKDWYKDKIVKMVFEIEDVWILEQIYKIVVNITEEGD